MAELGKPIQASVEALERLVKRKPILWLGPGAAFLSGHEMDRFLQKLAEECDDPLDLSREPSFVFTAFYKSMGMAALREIVDGHLARHNGLYQHIAKLAGAGFFPIIVTFLANDGIGFAMERANVPFVNVKQIEDDSSTVQLLKMPLEASWLDMLVNENGLINKEPHQFELADVMEEALGSNRMLILDAPIHPDLLFWLTFSKVPLKPWRIMTTKTRWSAAFSKKVFFDSSQKVSMTLLKGNLRPFIVDQEVEIINLLAQLAQNLGGESHNQNGIPASEPLIREPSKPTFHNSADPTMPFALKQIAIRDFQCIQQTQVIQLPIDSRWIFVIGDNGDGKTSLLQALAVGMLGDEDARSLLGKKSCRIEVEYACNGEAAINDFHWKDGHWTTVSAPGAFLAYGPSRLRIQGELSMDQERDLCGPVSSLHRQEGNLRNIEQWLKDRKLEAVDPENDQAQKRIDGVLALLVKLMPNVTKIVQEGPSITYEEKGQLVPANHLSAGHKSILAMIGDMVIRLMEQQPEVSQPYQLSGMVLIDEMETHLHPRWQVMLPELLTELFPKIQFIASTHSPVPFIGAPLASVFLKVTRDAEHGTKVKKLDLDITRLLPNTLLTSPLFDMETLVNRKSSDFSRVRTEAHYNEVIAMDAIDAKLALPQSVPDHLLKALDGDGDD